VSHALLGPIAIHLPERLETNDDLRREHPDWDIDQIEDKTGIKQRAIAGPGETASDLAFLAAEKLFAQHGIDRGSIDFVLFCTQTPDYPLPTTSCLLQDRLGLSTRCGALDFNLGCSGFVYGLSLAEGLIVSGAARQVLLLTGETYSKYIDPDDRSLRTIFGDAGAASLVTAHSQRSLWRFQFGTDGSGADTLLVGEGGARPQSDAIRPRHRKRWNSRLYMDGPSLINFTVEAIPRMIDEILAKEGLTQPQIHRFIMHQATRKMLQQIAQRMGVDESRMPIDLEDIGNTVSCTLPILIDRMRRRSELPHSATNMLVGFGVGLSWAGCLWQDLWGAMASDPQRT
jgi:3-oxoacyl-[acyl-carrier-protein] synthase-3